MHMCVCHASKAYTTCKTKLGSLQHVWIEESFTEFYTFPHDIEICIHSEEAISNQRVAETESSCSKLIQNSWITVLVIFWKKKKL